MSNLRACEPVMVSHESITLYLIRGGLSPDAALPPSLRIWQAIAEFAKAERTVDELPQDADRTSAFNRFQRKIIELQDECRRIGHSVAFDFRNDDVTVMMDNADRCEHLILYRRIS